MLYGTTCALPSPSPPALLTLLLPVARDGTSQDGTDEGGIVGDDGGAGSRRDVTGGDDTDDGANTSAECEEDEDDHTPSPSQPSEQLIYVFLFDILFIVSHLCEEEGHVVWDVSMSVCASASQCILVPALSNPLSDVEGMRRAATGEMMCLFVCFIVTCQSHAVHL